MHYAIEVVPFGEFGDPRNVMRLAQVAEAAGWEGLFVWDHMGFVWGAPAGDPWVTLAAVATSTSHLKLGVAVAPLPRYSPQVLARALTGLDLLSQGRVILGAGLGGSNEEFSAFGEPSDVRERAAMLDEALQILDRWMAGETLNFHGVHYTVENLALLPLPVQRPRIPIWIGGESRPAMRRAARWDGWVIPGIDQDQAVIRPPEQLAQELAYIQSHRVPSAPFDVAITGCSDPGQNSLASEYASAGATWWLESIFGLRGSLDEMLRRVAAGP